MNRNKIIFAIIAILLIVASTIAGLIISNKTDNIPFPKSELVSYFAETSSTKFINTIGQPIEGIAPPMLLEIFPNLREQDLDEVQTALGYYKYENNQLVYKPVGPQIHSATQTTTEEGWETLLDNLAERFDIELKNKNSVDKIIEKLYEELPGTKELTFRTISNGQYNLLTQRTQRVIQSQGAWVNLWSDLSPTDGPIPQVNFNEKMLIAVFQGQKPTGSYEIEITKIIERENEIVVQVKETSPDTNCAADAVITSPYHIVEIEKSSKPVRFIFEQETIECN